MFTQFRYIHALTITIANDFYEKSKKLDKNHDSYKYFHDKLTMIANFYTSRWLFILKSIEIIQDKLPDDIDSEPYINKFYMNAWFATDEMRFNETIIKYPRFLAPGILSAADTTMRSVEGVSFLDKARVSGSITRAILLSKDDDMNETNWTPVIIIIVVLTVVCGLVAFKYFTMYVDRTRQNAIIAEKTNTELV